LDFGVFKMFPPSSPKVPWCSQNVLECMVPKNHNKQQHKEYHNICVKVMFVLQLEIPLYIKT
jgi:hypothetical protein